MAAKMNGIDGNAHAENGEDTAGDGLANDLPLVFQCNKCNVIIADSISWICANETLRSITLSSVSNNVVLGNLTTSREGADIGSSYCQLMCKDCGLALGKMYKTTSRDLDHIRECFSLSVESCNSYQTGSGEQNAEPQVHDVNSALKIQLHQMQEAILKLNQRIATLETALKVEEESDDDDETETEDQENVSPPTKQQHERGVLEAQPNTPLQVNTSARSNSSLHGNTSVHSNSSSVTSTSLGDRAYAKKKRALMSDGHGGGGGGEGKKRQKCV